MTLIQRYASIYRSRAFFQHSDEFIAYFLITFSFLVSLMSIRPPAWNFVSVAHLQPICIYLYKVPSFLHTCFILYFLLFFSISLLCFFSFTLVRSGCVFLPFSFFQILHSVLSFTISPSQRSYSPSHLSSAPLRPFAIYPIALSGLVAQINPTSHSLQNLSIGFSNCYWYLGLISS